MANEIVTANVEITPAITETKSSDTFICTFDTTTIEGKIDDVIDLPEEYRHIFPLLVASYVWLDTEDAKAKYYRTLYEKNLAIIDSARYGSIDSSYRNINGWA